MLSEVKELSLAALIVGDVADLDDAVKQSARLLVCQV